MRKLGNISGKEAAKAFEKAGWIPLGQVGSHLVMVKPIDTYLEEQNQHPKPFLWTKTADEILDKPAPIYANIV